MKAPGVDLGGRGIIKIKEAILPLLTERKPAAGTPLRGAPKPADPDTLPLSANAVMSLLRQACPDEFVLVEESPSNISEMEDHFRIDRPDSFYTFASGCLGWAMPASVGLALAERDSCRNRPVVALMGDGSFQYSIQSLYTAVQQKAHVVVVVLQNEEYAILKSFAELEHTPNVPGLNLPGIDIVSLARGYGAATALARNASEVTAAVGAALGRPGASVVVVPITRRYHTLLG